VASNPASPATATRLTATSTSTARSDESPTTGSVGVWLTRSIPELRCCKLQHLDKILVQQHGDPTMKKYLHLHPHYRHRTRRVHRDRL
jgi:hypothetical protein